MIEVFKTRHIGFCYGVKRAIELVLEERGRSSERIYTIGPLIHNPQVVEILKSKDVIVEEDVRRIEKGTVVIRSHGIKKEEELFLKEKGLKIIDATCPFVKRVRRFAEELKKEGYRVIIIGDPNHPEVQSVLSYLDNDGIVLDQYKKIKGKRLGVVCQTTEDMEKFLDITKRLIEEGKEIKVFNTICKITRIREKEAQNLSRKVDLMLVVGGRISSNTKKLYRVVKRINPNTYHIETERDIDLIWLSNKSKIGITGGTSTPEILIENVIKFVKGLGGSHG